MVPTGFTASLSGELDREEPYYFGAINGDGMMPSRRRFRRAIATVNGISLGITGDPHLWFTTPVRVVHVYLCQDVRLSDLSEPCIVGTADQGLYLYIRPDNSLHIVPIGTGHTGLICSGLHCAHGSPVDAVF